MACARHAGDGEQRLRRERRVRPGGHDLSARHPTASRGPRVSHRDRRLPGLPRARRHAGHRPAGPRRVGRTGAEHHARLHPAPGAGVPPGVPELRRRRRSAAESGPGAHDRRRQQPHGQCRRGRQRPARHRGRHPGGGPRSRYAPRRMCWPTRCASRVVPRCRRAPCSSGRCGISPSPPTISWSTSPRTRTTPSSCSASTAPTRSHSSGLRPRHRRSAIGLLPRRTLVGSGARAWRRLRRWPCRVAPRSVAAAGGEVSARPARLTMTARASLNSW